MSIFRSIGIFALLATLKYLSRIFYRHDFQWVGDVPPRPWHNIRLVAFLNHTILFEPVSSAAFRPFHPGGSQPTASFRGRQDHRASARRIDLQVRRASVIAITRERDHTWFEVLSTSIRSRW